MSTTNVPAAPGQTNAIMKAEKSIADSVLSRVSAMQASKDIQLPNDYSAANALKTAHLILQETVDANKNPVLESCSKESIANALLSMVIQGLNPDKKQAYFIAYGGKLQLQRSYMGTVSLARRVAGVKEVNAQVVYEGDEFAVGVDVETGKKKVFKHVPNISNITNGKIVAAYCIVMLEDGSKVVDYMTFGQIQQSWNQGMAKGNSPAHQKFPEEMCKKTVISRALKMLINTSTDSSLYDDESGDYMPPVVDTTYTEIKKEIAENANTGSVVSFQDPEPVGQRQSVVMPKAEKPVPVWEEQASNTLFPDDGGDGPDF